MILRLAIVILRPSIVILRLSTVIGLGAGCIR